MHSLQNEKIKYSEIIAPINSTLILLLLLLKGTPPSCRVISSDDKSDKHSLWFRKTTLFFSFFSCFFYSYLVLNNQLRCYTWCEDQFGKLGRKRILVVFFFFLIFARQLILLWIDCSNSIGPFRFGWIYFLENFVAFKSHCFTRVSQVVYRSPPIPLRIRFPRNPIMWKSRVKNTYLGCPKKCILNNYYSPGLHSNISQYYDSMGFNALKSIIDLCWGRETKVEKYH